MVGTKTCFVIGPIGAVDSSVRTHSDQVLRHIIGPAARECGYGPPLRADLIAAPGMITGQVVQNVMDADMVVADLTGHNANVFYELAIRHLLRHPVVQLIQASDTIPFDVSTSRTIKFDLTNPDSVVQASQDLIEQMKAAAEDPSLVDNPISSAIDLKVLKEGGKTTEVLLGQVLAEVRDLKPRLEAIERVQAGAGPHSQALRRLAFDYGMTLGPEGASLLGNLTEREQLRMLHELREQFSRAAQRRPDDQGDQRA